MKPETIEKFIEKFAGFHLEYQDKQIEAIKNLSDEDLTTLSEAFRKQALGGDPQTCFGFRVEFWDHCADNLNKELWLRRTHKRAVESGLDYFCVACDGGCKGEDAHNKQASGRVFGESSIREMSREQLIAEMLKLRKS